MSESETIDQIREGMRLIFDALHKVIEHPRPEQIEFEMLLLVSVIPVSYYSTWRHEPVPVHATQLTGFTDRDNFWLTRDTAQTLSFAVAHPIGSRFFVRPLGITGFIEAVTDWDIDTISGRYQALSSLKPVLQKLREILPDSA